MKDEIKVFDAMKARKVLERVNRFLGVLIRENLVKDAPFLKDGELENESDLADDVWEVLQGVPRNCDIGTPDEHLVGHRKWCWEHDCKPTDSCKLCVARWAQMPYEEVK